MTEFNFSLYGTDVDRLFAIKELQGADDLTGNEFARLLLEEESFSEIESPSLLFRRGSLSLLRKRKSNLIRIQQARCPSRRKDSGGPPVKGRLSW